MRTLYSPISTRSRRDRYRREQQAVVLMNTPPPAAGVTNRHTQNYGGHEIWNVVQYYLLVMCIFVRIGIVVLLTSRALVVSSFDGEEIIIARMIDLFDSSIIPF